MEDRRLTQDVIASSNSVLLGGSSVYGPFTESHTPSAWRASSPPMLPWNLVVVNMDGLKKLAQRVLHKDSALRMLILSEPDDLPRIAALAKIDVFLKLLYRELEDQR